MLATTDLDHYITDLPARYVISRAAQEVGLEPNLFRSTTERTSAAPAGIIVCPVLLDPTKANESIARAGDRLELAMGEPAGEDEVSLKIAELKRMLLVSWEELASLLGCSRQALHKWMSGKPINSDNHRKVARLHAAIKFVDRGNAEENRALLTRDHEGGGLAWDLLKEERFDEFRKLVGRGAGRPTAQWGTAVVEPAPSWYERLVASDHSEEHEPRRKKP